MEKTRNSASRLYRDTHTHTPAESYARTLPSRRYCACVREYGGARDGQILTIPPRRVRARERSLKRKNGAGGGWNERRERASEKERRAMDKSEGVKGARFSLSLAHEPRMLYRRVATPEVRKRRRKRRKKKELERERRMTRARGTGGRGR